MAFLDPEDINAQFRSQQADALSNSDRERVTYLLITKKRCYFMSVNEENLINTSQILEVVFQITPEP